MRHPIERLLSAYRDRVAGLKVSYTFYLRLAKTLRLKRTDAILPSKKKGKGGRGRRVAVPSWPEFVSYILKTETQHDVSQSSILSSRLCWIISNNWQDLHWSLYTTHCSPCLANFTYIVHLEDREEEDLVLRLTGLADVVGGNQMKNPTKGGNTTAAMQVNTISSLSNTD